MPKVIFGLSMSLDGFINDREGGVGSLYPDFAALHETESLKDSVRRTGAVVMGRRTYDMAEGNWEGYEYQVPIFVVTHTLPTRKPAGLNDRLGFLFIPEGFESAVAQAKTAAGDRDVTIVGGADAARQCLNAGLVDEVEIGLVPVLLGGGLRLFEGVDTARIVLEQTRVLESPGRADITYTVTMKS